jgi:hypothetical protein
MEMSEALSQRTDRTRLPWPVRLAADGMLARYVDWREDTAAVADAYRRWSDAAGQDTGPRFSAYLAALDQEESSAASYADAVAHLERLL